MDRQSQINYYHFSSEDAVGYMRWHFEALQRRGVDIRTVLDIGAAHGHFADFIRTVYPKARVTCIECNELDSHYLADRYDTHFVCLGKEDCTADFYINPADPVGGGSSFYLENTHAFAQPEVREKQLVTLDSLNLGPFDLIKMDTQGSEIDILQGGGEAIRNARFVLIECSFLAYNQGGCLIGDVIDVMKSHGFRMLDTFGPVHGGHAWGDYKTQTDVLFAKSTDPIFEFAG